MGRKQSRRGVDFFCFPPHSRSREIDRLFCLRCFRPQSACFCGDIQAIRTHTRFVILMHPKEARKVKLGTGRLTHLCLKNSEILQGIDFTEDQRVNRLIKHPSYCPVILYPGENSIDISEFRFPDGISDSRKLLVFVIDASWPLAKKILKESDNLHALPKIHFRPQGPSRYVIKKQPHKYCLSTIESVYVLLEELEEMGIEKCGIRKRLLLDSLEKICRHQLECTKDASLPGYRKNTAQTSDTKRGPDESRYPGKRQRRSVCFD